jgi:hypothetical protein
MADETVQLAPKSLADLRKLSEVYRGAEKDIKKGIRDALKAAGKPLADEVVRAGSAEMPARGGLRARIASSRGTVSGSFTTRGATVSIRIADRLKDSLGGLDEGLLRHPVFGHATYVAQQIPKGAFTNAFDRGAPETRDRVARSIQQVLEDIARRA